MLKRFVEVSNREILNFLGHLFLSHACSDDIVLGNFLADLVRPYEYKNLPASFADGLRLHRLIDEFTDSDVYVKRIIHLFRDKHGKYSPVVTDVVMDYLLHQNWGKYSPIDFTDFCCETYAVLTRNFQFIPVSRAVLVRRMIDRDFLKQYASREGMEFVFSKLAERANFENQFDNVFGEVLTIEKDIDALFNLFFPKIIHKVQEFVKYL